MIMFHSFARSKYSILLLFTFFFIFHTSSNAETPEIQISSVTLKKINQQEEIRIKGTASLVSTVYELPNPPRIVVDIADAKIAKDFVQSIENENIKLATSEVPGAKSSISRFEFTLPEAISFNTKQNENEIVLLLAGNNSVSKNGETSVNQQQPVNVSSGTKQAKFSDVSITKENKRTKIQLLFDETVSKYNKSTVDKSGNIPPQLIIDIDNATSDDAALTDRKVDTALSKIQIARRDTGLRFSFHSSSDALFPYSINAISNGLEIIVDEARSKDQVTSIINQQKIIDTQLPSINPLDAKPSPKAKEQQMQDAFNFSGYNKERITVEFQKMDLHNVFNFLRQVSGVNIVVDESVEGALTLVLDDVPWDFALDIILNLKDLEKEERFNTLVIYPKGKGFKWPEQAQNNLSFEADSAVMERDTLIVQQQEKQSAEIIEAKELITKGRGAERQENFETAAGLYEQALEKWPKNSKLANKIASIYLVQLQQNAKSLYFAKRAIEADPRNESALLNAAIASANMQDTRQAESYFKQSTSGPKPLKESLLNYAAFSEHHRDLRSALAALNRHDSLYGKNLDSMVATARIHDKLGEEKQATAQYRAILSSGFQIPPDLEKFIKGRVAVHPTL